MSRLKEPTNSPAVAIAGGSGVAESQTSQTVNKTLVGKNVCPYCGHQYAGGPEPCPHCTMEDTPATRQATKARIGPWYVLQTRNPAAPGMRYATLLALINKGQVTPRSVLRGPTTHQLWRFAAHVRGVSREFGLCFSCGGAIDRTSSVCPHCERSQEPPLDPDVLVESRGGLNSNAAGIPEPVETTYSQRMRELNRQQQRGAGIAPGAPPIPMPAAPARGATTTPAPNTRALQPVVPDADERNVSAMALAAALNVAASDANDRPRWRVIRALSLMLLIGVAVCASMLYFVPEYRQPTYAWFANSWTAVKSRTSSAASATSDWVSSKFASGASGKEGKPVSPPAAPTVPRRPPPSMPLVATDSSESTKTAQSKPQPQVSPSIAADSESSRTSQQASNQSAVRPQTPPSVPPIAVADAVDQARKMWRDAIDAEARHDFAAASRIYEEIKRLPSDAWPGGLQNRLDQARKRLQSSSAAD